MKAILKDTKEVVDIVEKQECYISYIRDNKLEFVISQSGSTFEKYFNEIEFKDNRYDLFKSVLSAMIGNKSMDLYSDEQHNEIIKTSLNITDKALKALNND